MKPPTMTATTTPTAQAAAARASQAREGHTIIAGLGRTGLSCARYLRSRGESFAVTDSRATPPEADAFAQLAPEAQVRYGAFDSALLEGAARIVVSPGVSPSEPFLREAAARGIPVLGDIELFAQAACAPIAAVTGTNGKSTVTTLVALMGEAAGRRVLAGGNLGRPALELLQEPTPDIYVLELSSFQLETTRSLRAAAAAVLNVSPDHMDRYGTLGEYAAAKARILNGCAAAIVNLDDALVRSMACGLERVLGFSLQDDPAAQYRIQGATRSPGDAAGEGSDIVLMRDREALARMSELKIAGLHNAANALAALALGEALGFARADCLRALRAFPGLPHRSQWVADVSGVRYIDDSKGTNVGATLAAVAGLPGPLVLIAGGQGKGQDFAPLAPAFRGKVRHVVLIGQDAPLLAAALREVTCVEVAGSMEQAVRKAAQVARAGETVLLSPACASLDMFHDYAHRGEEFTAAVRRLPA